MARKLSDVARCGMLTLLAGWAAMQAVRVSAETAVRSSPGGGVIENPFVRRSAQPRPAAVASTTDGEPTNYQNPFAGRATPPRMMLRVPRTGAAGPWRRPVQLPDSPTSQRPAAKVDHNVRPAVDAWDTLSPGDFPIAEPAASASPRASGPLRSGAPPDPLRFNPRELEQPPWLLPPKRVESGTPAGHSDPPATTLPLASPTHVDRSASQPVRSPPGAPPQSLDDQRHDPFDRTGTEVVEVSDLGTTRSAAPTGSTALPADSPNSGALYTAAQQAAESADSLDELADVVRLCQQGLAQRPRRELAESLRSLAAWAANRRGEFQLDAGQTRAALAEFDAAIGLDPNCWLALHNRAISRAQQGQADAALSDFDRVVELNPGLASAYRNRGELLGFVGRTEEAVADYSRALAHIPDDAELYDVRGHALHRLGRFQEAINDLDRSIELEPNNAEAYTHRGNAYAELGDFRRAVDDLEQALAADARCGGAYRSLAWLTATCPDPRFRDSRQAVAAAEQAAKLAPRGDPFVLDALAAAYASAGQYQPAVRYQTEAIAVAPESFAPQFAERLALYRQGRPFRNTASGAVADDEVRAASLESTELQQPVNLAH
jgi:tetratricopeptide (TPR) repeat protein